MTILAHHLDPQATPDPSAPALRVVSTSAGVRMAQPFVKWAGGKRGLLPAIAKHFPTRFETYLEPFVGGGAVFFHAQPARAVLGDLNAELVTAYQVLQHQADDLVAWLREQPYSEARFLELRAQVPENLAPVARAGRFIYLNKTCFNGLYRVNRRGQFNTSFGKYRDPLICDAENLRAVGRALASATILCRPYEDVTALAKPGDFAFLDSPYDGTWTGYTADGFGLGAQIALAGEVRRMTELGVKVVLTNADTPIIRELYSRYTVREVSAPRSISCKGDRTPAAELLVTNERSFDAW